MTLSRYRNQLIVVVWFAICLAIYAVRGGASVPLEALVVMLLYLLVATPVRAVPGWLLLLLFGIGNVIVPWTTVLIQIAVRAVTTSDIAFLSGVVAPTTEEVMKILPVVVLYAWKRPRLRAAFGAMDWMLCGLAVGLGSTVWEDVLLHAQGFRPEVPNILGIPLFAGFWVSRGATFIGHGASTAFIALALGWTRYVKRLTVRPPHTASPGLWSAFRASRVFTYSPAILVMLWMMIDHAGSNLRTERAWYWVMSTALYRVDGRGALAVYVFLIAIAITLVADFVVLRRERAPQSQTPPEQDGLERLRRAWRRILRSRQIRYALASSANAGNPERQALVADSDAGWSLSGFVKRSLAKPVRVSA
jgi:hypothetical protein